jgi:uncharacterized protein YkwD
MPARRPSRSLVASTLFAVVSVAAAIFLVVHLPGRDGQAAEDAAASHPAPSANGPQPLATSYHRAATAPAAPGPAGRAHHHAKPTARPAHPQDTPAAATPSSAPPASGSGGLSAAAQQVLALINQARAQAGLPAYTISSGLDTSAARHNVVMEGGCGLSHQCPGEPALGDRETAAGVHWTAAGENIGEGGPVASTSSAIAQMAAGLTQSMLDEKPPDDGHRLNILSSSFAHIGIAVARDSSGTVWLTQDFSN